MSADGPPPATELRRRLTPARAERRDRNHLIVTRLHKVGRPTGSYWNHPRASPFCQLKPSIARSQEGPKAAFARHLWPAMDVWFPENRSRLAKHPGARP